MSLHIVAVGMLDVKTFGKDTFFVQVSPTEVMSYEANRNGTVVALSPTPLPIAYVTAAIEKFNNSYRLEPPIAIASEKDLVGYLGKFKPVSATACQYVP